MGFEVPTDLINQVQIALRKDAGFSSYDPYDATPSPLPSLTAAIADLDQTSSFVRCNSCQGRLLSGIQSMICVYCGKQQKGDVTHEPIAFNSTYAYRFLLESLGLGGSEIIVPDTEESETNRGQKIPKDEILLSKLLDLRIPWLDVPEKSDATAKDKNLELNGRLVTLTGVDSVNYLQEPDSNVASNAFQGQSVQTNQINSQNVVEESGDDLSGWEASFQFADNHNLQESSNSADLFPNPTIDLTAHIDSVFGGGENLNDVKPNVDLFLAPAMANKLKEDDLFTTSLSQPLDSAFKDVYDQPSGNGELFQYSEWQSQRTMSTSVDNKVKSAESQPLDSAFNEVNDQASNNGDWFEDNQWQSQGTMDVGVGVDNNVNSAKSQTLDSASNDFNDQSSDNGEWFQDNQWQSQSAMNVGNTVNSSESQPLDSASRDVNTHSSGNGDWLEDNQGQSQSTVNISVDNDVNLVESQPLDSTSKNVKYQSSDSGDRYEDNQRQTQSTMNMSIDNNVSSAEPQLLNSAFKTVNDISSDNGDWFQDNQWQSQSSVNVGADNNASSAESHPLDSVSNDVNDQSSYNGDWFADNKWQNQSTAHIGVDNKVNCNESQPFNSDSNDVDNQSLYNGDWLEGNQWQSQSSVNVSVDKNVNSADAQPLDLPSNDYNNISSENGDWFAWQKSTMKVEVDTKASSAEFQPLDLPSKEFHNQSSDNGDWFAGNQWQSQSTVNVEVDSNANSAEFQPSDLPSNDFNNQSSDNGDWFADNQWKSQSTVNVVDFDSKANSAEFQPLDLPCNDFNNQSSDNGDWFADNQWQSQSTVKVEVDTKASSAEFQPLDLPSKDVNNQSSDNGSDNGDWIADNKWKSQSTANVDVDSKANSAESQLDLGSKELNYYSPEKGDWFDNKLQSQSSVNAAIENSVNPAESQTSDSAVNCSTLANPSSESFDWFSDNQWQRNIISVPDNNAVNENEDKFDEWNEFTSSNTPHENVLAGPNLERNGDLSSDDGNTDKILKPKDDVEMLMSSMYDFSLMRQNNKINNASSQSLDSASKGVNNHSSDNANLFQDSQLHSQNAVNVCLDKEVKSAEARPLDSAINNLTLDGPSSESIDWLSDNQWQTVVTSVSNDKTIDENDDSFDEWNDFTSANNPEEVSSITNAIKEKISVINNSHSIYQEVDLGNFFPGGSNLKRNVELPSSTLKPKDDIEILMSSMHDFSVMHKNIVSNNSSSQPLDSDNVDWFRDNQWQSQSTVNAGSKNVNSAESQPLDSAVNSLTLSNPSLHSIDWFNDNQWHSNTTSALTHKTLDENEDSFDEWNDFTSANNPQEISSSINDKILDKNMFSSPGNFQELDFGSFFPEGSIPKRYGNSNTDTILKK